MWSGLSGATELSHRPRPRRAEIVADYGRKHDSVVACFMDDFEACIAHPRFPVTHRRAMRTTSPLERLFVEERRRLSLAFLTHSARGRS